MINSCLRRMGKPQIPTIPDQPHTNPVKDLEREEVEASGKHFKMLVLA